MVKLSIQTGGAQEVLGVDGAYRLIRECGFDGVDANIDQYFPYKCARDLVIPDLYTAPEKDYLEAFRPWRDGAKKYGLENLQAHAPFPSMYPWGDAPEYNAKLLELLKRTIQASDYIDCRRLVIHPFFRTYGARISAEDEWNTNIESYSALIPTAKEYGVKILLENMFSDYRGKLICACCADMTTVCRYIDTLNGIAGENIFGFCLDVGHTQFASLDLYDAMTELGSRIEAFHVHDNDGRNDQHLAPYMGITDWDRFCKGLAAIGYDKAMSFETFAVWEQFPHALAPQVMKLIYESGKLLLKQAGLA